MFAGVVLAVLVFMKFGNFTFKEISMSFRSFFSGTKSPVEVRIDEETMRLLNVTTKVKEKQLELEQVDLQLKNAKLHQNLKLQEERHNHKLQMEEATEKLERATRFSEEDAKRNLEQLEAKHAVEVDEIKVYLKMDSEQKSAQEKIDNARKLDKIMQDHANEINQANLDNTAELAAMRVKTAEDISTTKTELAKEYYDKMQDALSKMTLDGSAQTNFVKDLALKMFDKPSLPANLELHINKESKSNASG